MYVPLALGIHGKLIEYVLKAWNLGFPLFLKETERLDTSFCRTHNTYLQNTKIETGLQDAYLSFKNLWVTCNNRYFNIHFPTCTIWFSLLIAILC